MRCSTVRPGRECSFMGKNGCTFVDGLCKPIVEKCTGCKNTDRWNNIEYCKSYMNPVAMWVGGGCPKCTVIVEKIKEEVKKLNPLKASKKAAKAKKAARENKK